MANPIQKKKLPSGRHKSQIKRQRQNLKIAERNRLIRSDVRTYIKKVRQAAGAGDTGQAGKALTVAIAKIDKAVSKGLFHINNGARKISRLSKLVSSIGK